MISHQYARTNTPGMENYDASKHSRYIMYLDVNNLYGWAMSQPLLMSNFKWLTDEEMEELDFTKCDVSFLCTSKYPHELHDLHEDYPFVPERLQLEENLPSDYQRHLLQDEGFSKPPPKFAQNLCNKTNYIIHYRNLKL